MRAMVLEKAHGALQLKQIPKPIPEENQLLVKVLTCALCRTDLHIMDGELTPPKFPLVLGHQIVGKIESLGPKAKHFKIGDRIGAAWLAKSCAHCFYCKSDQENLCDDGMFNGYQINGGMAEYCLVDENFVFRIPTTYSDIAAAPLLCAGLIGYRAFRMAHDAKKIGFYGFGASAHILTQLAVFLKKEIYAFTRPKDIKRQEFAKKLGAVWAADSLTFPDDPLDAAIIFAPDGSLVPTALKSVRKAGIVICAGIHMSNIPSFPYEILWGERVLKSVSNLTRKDGREFLEIAPKVPIKTEVTTYPLENANEAFEDLRLGKFEGSAVLIISND